MEQLFEIIGVAGSLSGAWFMSRGFNVMRNAVMSFTLFLLSNVFLLNMAIDKMLLPLMVQMVFFTYFAINGLKAFAPQYMKKVYWVLGVAFALTMVHLASSLDKAPVLTFSILEFVAAASAITGNVFLSKTNPSVRVNAFYLFLLADTLYVYIGLDNGLYFFAMQAVYFLFTSLRAIGNTRTEFAK